MLELMRQIMRGELSPVMTAAILTGLRVKKETIGEISAAAEVMREFSNKVHVHDTAPSGGHRRHRRRRRQHLQHLHLRHLCDCGGRAARSASTAGAA